MREPSIHITEKLLSKLLSKLRKENPNILSRDLAFKILCEAKKYSLSHRKLLATNEKQRKAIKKVESAPLQKTMMVAKTIYLIRKSLKHRGIEIAKVGTKEWNSIKEISKNIEEFNELFMAKAKYEDCISLYINTAIKVMGKINVLRIPSLHTKVLDAYEAEQRLKSNDNVEYTERAYKSYNNHILNSVGTILIDYKTIPDKYQKFMEVAELCKKLKISPEIYIEAQFEGLKWANGIPDPTQLVGDKANERLQKYLFENQVQLRDNNKEVNADKVNKLKNILNGKH